MPIAISARVKLANDPRLDKKRGTVRRRTLRGTAIDIRRGSAAPFPYRMVLQTRTGEREAIFLSLDKGVPFPVKTGELVVIHYFSQWDIEFGISRRALVILDKKEQIRLIFQDTGLLPASMLPQGLEVSGGTEVVYTEAGRLAKLCYTVVEHRQLKVGPRLLAPGERTRLQLDGSAFEIVAADNMRTIRSECPDYRPMRLAWFAVRLPDP